jgi:hypothetical protein
VQGDAAQGREVDSTEEEVMSEHQKPTTQTYRDGWDRIFGRREEYERKCKSV